MNSLFVITTVSHNMIFVFVICHRKPSHDLYCILERISSEVRLSQHALEVKWGSSSLLLSLLALLRNSAMGSTAGLDFTEIGVALIYWKSLLAGDELMKFSLSGLFL